MFSRRAFTLFSSPPSTIFNRQTIFPRLPSILDSHQSRQMSTFKDINEYHRIADDAMESLVEQLWEVEDQVESNNIKGYDCEYSSGVLTLKLGKLGTYVINKQPPNQQIWLSSPISGPKRFDFEKGEEKWIYGREQVEISSLLTKELQTLLQTDKIQIKL